MTTPETLPDFRSRTFLLDHVRQALAAAALLGARTGDAAYWSRYDRLWAYCWEHFVDHRHGAWYRLLTRDNRKYSDEKSPAGKVDYHTMGACWEALNVVT
jgi:mannose/cellobiose epimerase-like protein (N-acyl-D-glucosamine 2-epimerase family)